MSHLCADWPLPEKVPQNANDGPVGLYDISMVGVGVLVDVLGVNDGSASSGSLRP